MSDAGRFKTQMGEVILFHDIYCPCGSCEESRQFRKEIISQENQRNVKRGLGEIVQEPDWDE